MIRIHTKRSVVESTYEMYNKRYEALSGWYQRKQDGDSGLHTYNDGDAEETRHEANQVFIYGDMATTMDAVFHMQLTMDFAKGLVKGLINCAEDFISILKGEEVYDLNTYNNCAASSTDILLFDDTFCPEEGCYMGAIRTATDSAVAQSIYANLALGFMDSKLSELQIMSVDVSSYEEVIRDCIEKQKRVYPLNDQLVVYAKGVKSLNDFVYNNLSPYVTEAGARQHVRPYIYDGEIGPCDEDIVEALEGLPFNIDMDDIRYTDDGFVLVEKPLGELLAEKYPGEDWSAYNKYYLTGLNTDGTVRFSLVRVSVGGGVSVPFKPFFIENFQTYMESTTDVAMIKLELDKYIDVTMTSKALILKEQELTDYYADSDTKGNYLIANLVVERSLEAQAENVQQGQYQLAHSYDSHDYWCQLKLDELEKKGIYDRETNTITFDPNNMSNDAYNAILMDTTGDPDTFAYAGENQYHAVRLNRYGDLLADHTFESDAGVGESTAGKLYEYHYKDPDSVYEGGDQREDHG